MKYSKSLERAEKLRDEMEKNLVPINKAIALLLGDLSASVFYQPSDGWVILFDGEYNARISADQIDCLLSMSKTDALEFLHAQSL